MDQPAAIRATYSEWRMVKGRKVLQLVMEVPLEQQQLVADCLGFPAPDTEIWVGIARLRAEGAQKPEGKQAKLAQRAGILCNEGAFNAWAREHGYEDGKAYIYDRCSVRSRSDLDVDAEAGERFREMVSDYDLWMRGVAA